MSLIKCTECGKKFSDKAEFCPKCNCPISEVKKNKKKPKKNIFLVIIGIIIIGIIIIGLIGNNAKTKRASYKYGNAIIDILNTYKDGNIEAKDAGEQLEEIYDEVEKEMENKEYVDVSSYDGSEYHTAEYYRLSSISHAAQMSYFDLYYEETMSILKINEWIEYIEDAINS